MPLPDPPDSGFPAPLAVQRVVRCLGADVEATQQTRELVRAGPATGDRSYLDRLVCKPWGAEFRVYEDDLTDVWSLHVKAGQRTSLHCHPRKLTALLCLEGHGTLSTCSGVRYALQPGAVLQIEPGAYHRVIANATAGLRLIEVETPKDKFDLLRIQDDYRNITEPYEGEQHAPLGLVEHDHADAVALALAPFIRQPLLAHRRARLRAPSSTGRYRFALRACLDYCGQVGWTRRRSWSPWTIMYRRSRRLAMVWPDAMGRRGTARWRGSSGCPTRCGSASSR